METAFLVLAHDRPAALKALLDDLSATGQPVFLHVDAASHQLDALMPELAAIATCIPRRAIAWGSFSMLAATLGLLESAHRTTRARHFVLLSNACMPIRPFTELQHTLWRADQEFVGLMPLEEGRATRRSRRLDHFNLMRKRTPRRLADTINRIAHGIPRRHFAAQFGEPRFGSSWWAFSRDFVDWLFEFRAANPGFDRRHRLTQFPDESYFQTAITRSPFAGRVAPALTFTDWSAGGEHPKTLTRADFTALEGSGYFFARKYFRESDPALTAELSDRWRR